MDCLQDETILRMVLGSFIEYAGPLSPKTSERIRTSFTGIDQRSVMLAALRGDDQHGMTLAAKTALVLCAAFVEVIPNPPVTERFQRKWRIC